MVEVLGCGGSPPYRICFGVHGYGFRFGRRDWQLFGAFPLADLPDQEAGWSSSRRETHDEYLTRLRRTAMRLPRQFIENSIGDLEGFYLYRAPHFISQLLPAHRFLPQIGGVPRTP